MDMFNQNHWLFA